MKLLLATLIALSALTPFLARADGGVDPAICLATRADSSGCVVSSAATGFLLRNSGNMLVIELHHGMQTESHSVHDILAKDVATEDLTEDEANAIQDDLFKHQDIVYRLPTDPAQLRTNVGFTPDAVFSPADHVELLKVHMQIFLGVSAPTATYLGDLMKITAGTQPPAATDATTPAPGQPPEQN